jgi:HD-GYP domain-containing protein (c-di-GMP phosphodiesterase class II)
VAPVLARARASQPLARARAWHPTGGARAWLTAATARRAAPRGAGGDASARRLLRYLPLALLTTGLVTALPALLVAAVLPKHGAVSTAASVALVVAVSLAIASGEAALWKRWRRSRDIVFADLMLWGWVRRAWNERRLARARDLLKAAKQAGPEVSIEILQRVSKLLEARDAYTHGHSERVMRHAGRIAQAMQLPPAEIAKIRMAAAVHDVGKLHTPREILNNPNRLTDAEYEVMKRHAAHGADMLADVGAPDVAAMVRHHHERFDGSGYPDRLAGTEIPLGARIIAVADTFDAITSSRPYRTACSQKKALNILARDAGRHFDREAVAAFRSHYSSRRSVAWFAFATTLPQLAIEGLRTTTSSLAGVGSLSSILPAVGAAGGLALSHGAHVATPSTHRVVAGAQATVASHTEAEGQGLLAQQQASSAKRAAHHGHSRRAARARRRREHQRRLAALRRVARARTVARSTSGAPASSVKRSSEKQSSSSSQSTTTTTTQPTTTTKTETTPTPPPKPAVEVPTVTVPGGGTVEVPTELVEKTLLPSSG